MQAAAAAAGEDELRRMSDALTHRGPDDEGHFVSADRRCGLAFRRLSIIDLDTGGQPISNEAGDLTLVFNGEIYNYRALREGLLSRGHVFRTQSDSEVIAHLFEEHGEETFALLDGMFAIAIWDEKRRTLTLARDRFGKKPLHYAVVDGRLLFASELKAILALPGVPRVLSPEALHRYFAFQYVPAPHSIFRGFAKLPPATSLTLRAGDGAVPAPRAYWSVPRPAPFDGTYREALEELPKQLSRAVAARLISDVPLGAFLSGGLDSSIVVGLMRRLGVSPLRTFSIGFSDPRYDESDAARAVAQQFGTEHHEFTVTPKAAEVTDLLAYHFDEPFADSSAIPTYYVAKFTRQSVTVALTGDGGDECFAGYERYAALKLASRFDVLPRGVRSLLATGARLLPQGKAKSLSRRAARFAAALRADGPSRYLSWIAVIPPHELSSAYRPEFLRGLEPDALLTEYARDFADAPAPDALRANYFDYRTYIPFDILTKVDVASMACSLECRAPFLDHHLVEWALSLPLAWRLGRGGKHILRDWARTLLPPEILLRPKTGFGVPVGEWFRAELRDALAERLFSPEGLCRRIFREQWLRRKFDAHASGRNNFEHALWALYALENWALRWRPTLG